MIKILNRKKQVLEELGTVAIIFGEKYNIKVVYQKITNPELILEDKSIIVNLPNKYKKNNNINIIKLALEKMYDEIARIEIENAMEETRVMLNGLAPENYIIKRMPKNLSKTMQNNTLIINPDVIKYDKKVLKYVLLYEFCHLKYKTTSKKFWQMIEKYMPTYEEYEYIREIA